MKARRGQVVEDIFSAPALARDVMPFHGGRRIRLYDNGQGRAREWHLSGTSWTEVAYPPDVDGRDVAGAYTSLWGYSHDLDQYVKAYGSGMSGKHATSIQVQDLRGGGTTRVATHDTPTWHNMANACGRQYARFARDSTNTLHFDGYGCAEDIEYTVSSRSVSINYAVFSPVGDKVFLAISEVESSGHVTSFEPCAGTDTVLGVPSDLCRRIIVNQRTAGSKIYSVQLSDTTNVRTVWASGSGEIVRIGLGEDALEAIAHIGEYAYVDTTYYEKDPVWNRYDKKAAGGGGITGCRTEYRSIVSGDLLETVPISGDCLYMYQGTSTISGAPLITTSNSSPAAVPGGGHDQRSTSRLSSPPSRSP